MPSYHNVLSETQIWQVTLLLANADKPLPPAALQLVNGTDCAKCADPDSAMPREKSSECLKQRVNCTGEGKCTMKFAGSLRKGFGYVLLSMGVSRPAPKAKPEPNLPQPKPDPGSSANT